jgi:hypothetical protein
MYTFRDFIRDVMIHEQFSTLCLFIIFCFTGLPLILYAFPSLSKHLGVTPRFPERIKQPVDDVVIVAVEQTEPSLLSLAEDIIEPEPLTSQDVIDDAVSALRNIGFTKKAAVVAVNNACINERFDDPIVLVKATLSRSNV